MNLTLIYQLCRFLLHLLNMTGRTIEVREDVSGMIQEVIAEVCSVETTMKVGNGIIQKGIHVVDMTMTMVEKETDMKVPGEHQVCNICTLLYLYI